MIFLIIAGVLPTHTFADADEGSRNGAFPIRSASEIEYPPFCIVNEDGRADGFSVELMRAALAAMGRDVTFKTGPWADVRSWLEKGEIQALPLVGRTPEREAIFDFTFPYMTLHGAIVVQKGMNDIRSLNDLAKRRVAVMKGDNAEEFMLRENPDTHLTTTLTFEQALKELSAGQHDAVVMQQLLALRLIQKTGITNLQIIRKPIEKFRQDFCFAVSEGDRGTLALLNEGLALVMADGTYRQLHAKWFAALELPSSRHVVIGGDHNYPPYEFLDEHGRPVGFNVDMTKAIAREAGLDIDIRLDDWENTRKKLASGEIDAVHGMFYSADRDLNFNFTPPHTVISHVAVVRRDAGKAPESLTELAGKRLVVMEGDIMQDFVTENRLTGEMATVPTQEQALREVAEGLYDCALVAKIPALYWIEKNGWDHLAVGQRPILSSEYCYAVPNNRKILLARLSEGLKVIGETGEFRKIHNKWLGSYEKQPVGFLR